MKNIFKKLAAFATAAVAVMSISAMLSSTVSAEGSKELVQNGGYRPFLEYCTSKSSAGLTRINKIHVFAKAGETLSFGSSTVASLTNGKALGNDIVVTYPDGSVNNFDVISGGVGNIDTLAKEAAGPHPEDGGYEPLTITVAQTGIYVFEFRSTNPAATDNPKRTKATAEFNGMQGSSCVAAWDITVSDAEGAEVKGRAYETYICLNTADNSSSNESVAMSDLYILTADGYQYRVGLNGMDPWGFVLFANNRGFVDKTSNTSLYKTIICNNNDLMVFNGNVSISTPSETNTSTTVTHKIFFNKPANDLPSSIPTTPIIPSAANDFYFDGTAKGETNIGVGGIFTIDVAGDTTYEIYMDIDGDGTKSEGDVVLANSAAKGKNTIYWNGKDSQDNIVPTGEYNVYVHTKGGEYHFPLLDVESNPNGIQVELLNAPYEYEGFDPYAIYYDDADYVSADGTSVVSRKIYSSHKGSAVNYINPVQAFNGVNSENGAMAFTNYYGDQKGLDFWTYFLGDKAQTTVKVNNVYGIDANTGIASQAFVSGYIFFDKNKDAKFDMAESPLGGIGLTITDSEGTMHEAVTDGAGHYMTFIAPGEYTVEVTDVPTTYILTTNNDVQTGSVVAGIDHRANIGYYLGLDAAIDITSDKDVYTVGEIATFIVDVTNMCDIDASYVTASAVLPAYATFISCNSDAYDGETGTWNVGALEAGDSKTIKITAKVTKPGIYSFPATVSAEEDINEANNTASLSYEVKACAPETGDHTHYLTANSANGASDRVIGTDAENTEMTYKVESTPAHGRVTLDEATGAYTYIPEIGYVGDDVFTVLVTNAYGETALSTITIQITELPYDVPTLSNDYAYIFGRDDENMMAEDSIYRGEACAVIYRLMKQNDELGGFSYDKDAEAGFTDIFGRWDRSAIEYLTYNGAYTPYDGPVCPDSSITRGEAFKIICLGLGFTDDAKLSLDSYASILVQAGFVEGYEDGTLRLSNIITRAEFCTIYNRITGRNDASKQLIDENGNAVTAETYGFVDLDSSKWYYDAMVRATSAFDGDHVSIANRGIRNQLDDYSPEA